jgi:GMP synthase-like glutamine amidotransferase
MRTLAIVHQRDAGPGVFAEATRERGVGLDTWLIAEDADPPGEPAGYDAVIAFGGAMHVDQEDSHPWLAVEKRLLGELHERGMPLLGVCLGAQLLSAAVGGSPARATEPEIGWPEVEVTEEGAADPVLGPLAPRFEAFEWHSYEAGPPDGATVLALSPVCVQAYRLGRSAWGIQFHAEVTAADAAHWIRHYDTDEDAVRIGLDPEAFAAETRDRIDAWNQLGRDLCTRFLESVSEGT